jgi:hypothetical protein
MIMPSGTSTLGGALQFMTGDGGLGSEGIQFTDVVLLSLHARRSFKHRFEVFGATGLVPKQPSFTDELIWQNVSLGGRVGLGKRYAVYAAAAGGPLLADRGLWAGGGGGVQARKNLHETMVLEGGLGAAYTSVIEETRDQPSWLGEITAAGELVFRDPRGSVAFWIGTEFRFPVAHGSSISDAGEPAYQPQTRVNFYLGFVLSYIENWDIYTNYIIIDRGDLVDPTTTLPILVGGFDQQQLIIGLTRRFRPTQPHPRHAMRPVHWQAAGNSLSCCRSR